VAGEVTGGQLCYRDGGLTDCGDWFDSVEEVLGKLSAANRCTSQDPFWVAAALTRAALLLR